MQSSYSLFSGERHCAYKILSRAKKIPMTELQNFHEFCTLQVLRLETVLLINFFSDRNLEAINTR